MYEAHFDLREPPFDAVPDPRFLVLAPTHRQALRTLEQAVMSRGIVLLTGEAGTGKTAVLRAFLAGLSEDVACASFDNPSLTRSEFFECLWRRLGLGSQAPSSKVQFLHGLESIGVNGSGPVVVVIDEAQSLPVDLLEEVRLLSNTQIENRRVLTFVLVGQPELAARLDRPELRGLKQRITLRASLRPLDLQETAAYIAGRIRVAGGDPARTFTRGAVIAVHEGSGGVARTINTICDNALALAHATNVRPIGSDIVAHVTLQLAPERETPTQGASI